MVQVIIKETIPLKHFLLEYVVANLPLYIVQLCKHGPSLDAYSKSVDYIAMP